mmetsp:Transcript_55611/g.126407  ORF Transcript_55611/g.126407 Transcript_55611/m.126407 type:complete len:530 (+) Transcript_55611:324-1913(+)
MDPIFDSRPDSLLQCLDEDGELALELVYDYHDRVDDEWEAELAAKALKSAKKEKKRKRKHPRKSPTASNFMKMNRETGEMERMLPEDSTWYTLYVANAPSTPRQLMKFRRRARMPYQKYLELVEDAREGDWFPNVGKPDATGRPGAPLELLVLGALRYLGRGWTFDDIEEATAISEETNRRFLHEFIRVGATIMYDKYVVAPTTAAEAEEHMHEFEEAGFPGCPLSSDGTHVVGEKIQARLKNQHIGGKESHTARAYNTSVNHRRRILFSTRGSPSSWNDKTLVLFGSFLAVMYGGSVLSDVKFDLQDYDESGEVITVLALAKDGLPTKWPGTYNESGWSRWLESMRKDAECAFVITKGRFRILKTGIRLHGVEAIDHVWATCCALHNFLLEADGLNERWEEGVKSDREGPMEDHDEADVPLIFQRVRGGTVHTDFSGMGNGGDESPPGEAFGTERSGGSTAPNSRGSATSPAGGEASAIVGSAGASASGRKEVRMMEFETFRQKLVTHFSIKWERKEIKWPSRNGVME